MCKLPDFFLKNCLKNSSVYAIFYGSVENVWEQTEK